MKNTNFILSKENANVLRSYILRMFNATNSLKYSGIYPQGKKSNTFMKNCGLSSRYRQVARIQTKYFMNEKVSFRLEDLKSSERGTCLVVRINGILVLSFPIGVKLSITPSKMEWKSKNQRNDLYIKYTLIVNKDISRAKRYIDSENQMREMYDNIWMADAEKHMTEYGY